MLCSGVDAKNIKIQLKNIPNLIVHSFLDMILRLKEDIKNNKYCKTKQNRFFFYNGFKNNF